MTRADLLVVGAGPAGSAVAALAAASGARVVVLEKDRFPRDKVCGEFLSAEGCAVLGRLGLLDAVRAVGAVPIASCLLADPRGRAATAELPELPGVGREALGISRRVLDETLARRAAAMGAAVHEGVAATAPILESGRVVGVRTRSGVYRATVVVAADGRRSVLQRALHPDEGDPMRTTTRSWFGFQTHFPDRNSGRRIELFVFEGGYAGLGPVEGGRLNLALIASVGALKSSGGSPDRLLENRMLANPLLAGRIGGRSPSSPWKTVGPLRFGTRRPAAAGAIFLGDAAGTTDPFSGEGMSNALAAAELALPFVLAAVAAGGLAPAAARAWSRAWRAAFSRATWRARLFGRLFQHERTALWAMSWLSTRAGASLLPRLIAATRTGPL